jgi:coenzyme F420-dependent glucose-6-phosphate dehydrogenase
VIGYHASHEQFPPDRLLNWARAAEAAGFEGISSSDHFAPWSRSQGESGFAWSWMGAAMAVTSLPFLVVNAPGQRYHPAIVAQASATLEVLFPGRFRLAVGSGQLMNEHITGGGWPTRADRNERLRLAADAIRALWAGRMVQLRHRLLTVEEAVLATRPPSPPLLVGAAVTPETGRWLGEWADALITVSQPDGRERAVLDAFREGGGAGRPAFLQVHLAWDPDEAVARRTAWEHWRFNAGDNRVMTDLRHPEQLEAATRHVRPDDMDGVVRISGSLERHAAWLREDLERFDGVYLHEVGPDQDRFIETFGREVLPALR